MLLTVSSISISKIGFKDRLSLNAGQKYSTFIKLLFVSKIFVLSIFDLPFYTGLLFMAVRV